MRDFGGARRMMAAFAALVAAPVAAFAECGPPALQAATLERIGADGALELSDGRRIRLAGLHDLGDDRTAWPRPGDALAVGMLDDRPDRWGRLPAIVFTVPALGPPVWLQQRLIEQGASLARPEAAIAGCWPLLTRAEAASFARPPALPAEAGRFASVSGRVTRVGEGRSANFINLHDRNGARVTGLVQKRHLARLRQAGVDVEGLRGHVIRLRGTRSVTNPAVIPVTMAEQIEILR